MEQAIYNYLGPIQLPALLRVKRPTSFFLNGSLDYFFAQNCYQRNQLAEKG